MSTAMGSSLLHLLRILTPFEVGKLTNDLEDRNSRSALQKIKIESALEVPAPSVNIQADGQAKILPFNEIVTEEESKSGSRVINQEIKKHDQFLAKIGLKSKIKKVSGGENFEEDDEENTLPQEEQVSTTIFLLQEKEKIKKSQLKLVGQDALKTYRIQAAVDTSHEDKEDLSQSSSSGILVNKRQF